MSVAFLFSGQGSQSAGMGSDIHEKYDSVRDVYQRVSEATGIDVANVSFGGKTDYLKNTECAQVAIVTMSLAINQILTNNGINPSIAAGHSLGELSALIAAEALNFEDGINLVQKRAQAMSAACRDNPGCMAAVMGINRDDVEQICSTSSSFGPVCVANYNTSAQFVVSGSRLGVEAVATAAKQRGARVVGLNVAGGFHSALMQDASRIFSVELGRVDIKNTRYPLIGNVKASIIGKTSEILHDLMAQMLSPVRWNDTIELMLNIGIRTFVEIGPGKVLKGLVLRMDRNAEVYSTGSSRELEMAIKKLPAT